MDRDLDRSELPALVARLAAEPQGRRPLVRHDGNAPSTQPLSSHAVERDGVLRRQSISHAEELDPVEASA